MADNLGKHAPFDPASEGADARRRGHRREVCPYPPASAERAAWIEGFDGRPGEQAPDLPLDRR